MKPSDLRVALFSGNYNYVRDGANQALNRLVAYLLRQGVQVRVYSPTVEESRLSRRPATSSAFPRCRSPGGPNIARPCGFRRASSATSKQFNPNVVHVSSPDIVGHRAVTWARKNKVAAVASVHTRFDTYLAYYHLQALEPLARALMRRFYHRCEVVMAPAHSIAESLREQRMNRNIIIWARGVDREQFNPGRRDMAWRRSVGISDDEMVIIFLGRIVMEKGLDVFADAVHAFDAARAQISRAGDGRGTGAAVVRTAAAARDLYRREDRRRAGPRGRQRRRAVSILRSPKRSATSRWKRWRAACRSSPRRRPGAPTWCVTAKTGKLVDGADSRGVRQGARGLCARARASPRAMGMPALKIAEKMDWDTINSAVVRAYKKAIVKRQRLSG